MPSFFRISERNHLGVILMSELAEYSEEKTFISLGDVAKKMGVSAGYLEEIASSLKKAGLIEGRKGPNGGYRLLKPAGQITAGDMITALEGPIALVPCQAHAIPCPVQEKCLSQSLWTRLQKSIAQTLTETTLADLR